MVRNIIGFIAGYLIGSVVNFALIMVNMALMPAGVDFSNPDGVNAAMAQMGTINYLVVFLAHGLGAFVGALVASMIAVSHRLALSIGIGVLFLLGGIYAAVVIDAPLWFEAVDILFAYIPMAWLGWKIAGGKS